MRPETQADSPDLTTDTLTDDLEGLWTEDGGREADSDTDFWEDGETDTGTDTGSDTDTQRPLRYEDYLRSYLDGDRTLLSASAPTLTAEPNAAPGTTQEITPKTMAQTVSELAPKIQRSGLTPGRATIAAQQMYTEAEKRFGSDRDTVLGAYQPGQDPRQFLDGLIIF